MVKKLNNNDDKIMGLRKQIADKKAALKATESFSPRTNCSLTLDGQSTNIRAEMSKERLIDLLVKVHALKASADQLGVVDDFKISGYSAQDWITDIKARVMIVNKREEESRLKVLEDKLHALLSVDKKIELELDDLSKQI